jgi:hypothetical protein
MNGRNQPQLKENQNMKHLIGLIRLGASTAASVVAHRKILATKTLDRQLPQEGELVLLGIDGTVVAREMNLVPRAGDNGPRLFHRSITPTLAWNDAHPAHSDLLQKRLPGRNRRYQPWCRANDLDC